MQRRHAAGFTLLEVIVVIALVAILATVAVPSLLGMVRSNRAATQANAFMSALIAARSEAIKRGMSVSVCARSADDSTCARGRSAWRNGWFVFADPNASGNLPSAPDAVFQVFAPLSGASALDARQADATVTFGASGFLDPAAHASDLAFALAVDGCRGDQNRLIHINLQGRASVSRRPCR